MLFDLHAETERLAILRSEPDGRHKISLRTLQGQPLGEIPADLLPLEPHWSPDGSAIAFHADDTHGLMRHRDEIHGRVLEFLKQFE